MKNKLIIVLLLLLNVSYSQVYSVGDTVPSDFGLPWCGNNTTSNDSLFLRDFNGALNESGRPYVIWIMSFTSWCPYCEQEVPYTQDFYEIYADSGLIIIGMGSDWGQPYTCEGWVDNFGLGYPIISDLDTYNEYEYGGQGMNLFTDTYVPSNLIINHNMEIIYSQSGFDGEAGMNNIFNIITSALDECNLCTCSELLGDIDHSFSSEDEPIIDVIDLLKLSDLISSDGQINHCERGQGDFTGDGLLNTIDLFAFATMLAEGAFNN